MTDNDKLRAAAQNVVDAWVDDESGMETFDPTLIDYLSAALAANPASEAPPVVLADDTVCACLDETGERKVRLYERCQRCGAFMEADYRAEAPPVGLTDEGSLALSALQESARDVVIRWDDAMRAVLAGGYPPAPAEFGPLADAIAVQRHELAALDEAAEYARLTEGTGSDD